MAKPSASATPAVVGAQKKPSTFRIFGVGALTGASILIALVAYFFSSESALIVERARRAVAKPSPTSTTTAGPAGGTSVSGVPLTGVIHDYYWTVTNFTDAPDGVSRTVLGINNKAGDQALIEVNLGDRIRVHVQNGLTAPTSIHWHGMFQNGSNIMDGPSGVAQCPIPPGKLFVYDFIAAQTGSYWWHSHYMAQYVDGLRGPLIIHDPKEKTKYGYTDERTLTLADWYNRAVSNDLLAGYLSPTNDGSEPVPDSILVNGNGFFECKYASVSQHCVAKDSTTAMTRITVNPGTTYRFRLISMSSFTAYNFSIDGLKLTIIETDGVDTMPYAVDRITINNGQRYSVLVTTPPSTKAKNTYIRVIGLHDYPWTASPPGPGYRFNGAAILQYAANSLALPTTVMPKTFIDFDQSKVGSNPPAAAPSKATVTVPISFTFQTTATDPIQRAYVAFNPDLKNLHTYQAPATPVLIDLLKNKKTVAQLSPNSNVFELKRHDVVDLIVINYDGGEHPWHLHGHTFWIMGQGTATAFSQIPKTFPTTNPPRRDVVTLQACDLDPTSGDCAAGNFGYTVLRFVADNPGVWFFHCHIEWHIEAGLALVFAEALSDLKAAQYPFPQCYTDLCV
ncbi:Cupredoxin [Fimicolochytrium jonesii]|uniref:Cupredoxin n=1 Tax=Fimicolochytrium jonesii TaxID=1396493 RepID=UPI0022FEA69F|nr:Cupredoxin [Fimicolochytrium jonesii]KAI8824886.1 Cupredoxin [Fimicolochytrium jonesii]